MRNIASFFKGTEQAGPTVEGSQEFKIFTTAGMESIAHDISAQFPEAVVQVNVMEQASLESQQMDQKKRDDMLTNVQDQLNQLVSGAKKTGPVQVFLLDGQGLAAGDPNSQATMHALAHSALTSPDLTLAAFLSKAAHTNIDPEQALDVSVESMYGVVKDFLVAKNVKLVRTRDELVAALR